jgi:hypothetical protein
VVAPVEVLEQRVLELLGGRQGPRRWINSALICPNVDSARALT